MHSYAQFNVSSTLGGHVLRGRRTGVGPATVRTHSSRPEEAPTRVCPAVSPVQDEIIHQNCSEETS